MQMYTEEIKYYMLIEKDNCFTSLYLSTLQRKNF